MEGGGAALSVWSPPCKDVVFQHLRLRQNITRRGRRHEHFGCPFKRPVCVLSNENTEINEHIFSSKAVLMNPAGPLRAERDL